jgi:diguanylate cyclase (GGDEF)-like protein
MPVPADLAQPAPVLVVEDSRTFAGLLARGIQKELGLEVVLADTLDMARRLLAGGMRPLAGLLDLNLPDAPAGEIVDLVVDYDVPVVVFTGEVDENLRQRIWTKPIVDYVPKESPDNVAYVLDTVHRIMRNPAMPVLVADDSPTMRAYLAELLRARCFPVLEAADGTEALEMLEAEQGVRLVITDYDMPGLDGFELVRAIRRTTTRQDLAVIGLSGADDESVSALFLKHGANDFLNKPFSTEEFHCRVMHNVEMLENFARIRDLSQRDFLTGAYNRRYFFEKGRAVLKAGPHEVCTAMVDLDRFKAVNDTHGHEAGDRVIKATADFLGRQFPPPSVVARFGGEEFCVLRPGLGPDLAGRVFEELRAGIADLAVETSDNLITFTASIGVCARKLADLDKMIARADEMLYRAKESGRDRVEVWPLDQE